MEPRVALITGGTRGIGLGCAEALASEGWSLALCGVRPQAEVEPFLGGLRSLGGEVMYLPVDVGDDDAPERLVAAVSSRFDRLDLLVNNAGVAPKERRDLLEATQESFDRVLRTNLRGPYFLTQAAARLMMATAPRAGPAPRCIIFVTSVSAVVASTNRGEYCVSKAGLSMASLLWAARLAEEGISVFEVRPGVIRTDMTASVAQRYDRLLEDGLALQRRWGTAEDVGRAVAMLARGELAYSTGQVITVDGGLTLQRM
jgi:NAD(P)-dependent dehydrogenase (short-subunit alcohol dehydrogenase family)